MTVRGELPTQEEGTVPCKEARESLTFAIIGYFFFGILFGAIAIVKGLKAKRSIEVNPRLSGWGKANTGIVLGIIVIILSTLGMLFRFQSVAKTF